MSNGEGQGENPVPSNLNDSANQEKQQDSLVVEENTVEAPNVVHSGENAGYASMTGEELLKAFKTLLNDSPLHVVKEHADNIRTLFDQVSRKREKESREKFIASGGLEENYTPKLDSLQKEFNALYNLYRSKRESERTSTENNKERNLQAKYEVIDAIKELINRQESLNDTFQEFQTLQQRWREIGPVPQGNQQDLWETFHHHVENFYNYIKINKELRDLDLKRNYEAKLGLCEKVEALLLDPSAFSAFKSLQKYHDEWREIGPIPRDKKEFLWDRFKSATAKINQKQQEHFETLKNQLKKNLDAKVELCEKVEILAQGEIVQPRDWEERSKQLIEFQQMWKTIGFAPKKENNQIYTRFRKACDDFFNKKREFFKSYKEDQGNNLQLKIELCMQAEALKDSQEWKKTTEELIQIQKKWKNIGPVPRKQSDLIWKRFRDACDHFFNNKSKFFSQVDNNQTTNLKQKEDLIEELKALNMDGDSDKCFANLQNFQRRWSEIGYVPIQDKERVNQEFKTLINQKFEHLNLDESNKNFQKFKNKLDNWKATDQFNEKIGQERSKLMVKLKQTENDIVLWENNIGFFAKSKNSEALISEFNKKIEVAKQNLKMLSQKLDQIDEML